MMFACTIKGSGGGVEYEDMKFSCIVEGGGGGVESDDTPGEVQTDNIGTVTCPCNIGKVNLPALSSGPSTFAQQLALGKIDTEMLPSKALNSPLPCCQLLLHHTANTLWHNRTIACR